MTEISILLVGDSDRAEFCEARAALTTCGQVTTFAEPALAVAALSEGCAAADLVVVAQDFPGQFSHSALDRLRRSAPSARVLGLLGSWCEGEMRTGEPWPGAIRIYWHQWPSRCHHELARIRAGESSAWGLPMTATEEERLLLAADGPGLKHPGLIAIHTPSPEMQGWLADTLRRSGCSTVWLRPLAHSHGHAAYRSDDKVRLEGAAAAIFDGGDCRGEELTQLQHLVATLHPAPTMALLDFPRIEDYHRAKAAGAAAVVSKPVQLDDLFWQFNRLRQAKTSDEPRCV